MVKKYYIQIALWTCIGLSLRLTLVPFTMHGQDLLFLNYFPMKFITEGIWDPYALIATNFSHFNFTYYGPVLFFIMSITDFIIIKLSNPASLIAMLELSGTMMGKHFTTVDYVHAFANLGLVKNLFIMKIPYLIFDFLIGGILLKLATSQKFAIDTYKLWMLNIVVLHSVYMVGGAYLIPTFFIAAALYAAWKKKPFFCVILLGLGGGTVLFPYILILPACLLLGDNWRKRFLLLLVATVAAILPYVPFYLSSGDAVFGIFMLSHVQYSGITKWVLRGIFMVLFSLLCINAVKDSRQTNPAGKLLYYFITVMFISYAALPIRFRYFIFITPLLALIIPYYKKFGILVFAIIAMLGFQWLYQRDLQLGLFAPLNPVYFSSLPTIQEIVGRFVNIEIVYKVLARALFLSFLAAAAWVWRIKLGNEAKEVMSC